MWDVASSDILAWRQNGARWSGPEDLRGPIINGGMDVIGDGDEQTLQAILGEYHQSFVLLPLVFWVHDICINCKRSPVSSVERFATIDKHDSHGNVADP